MCNETQVYYFVGEQISLWFLYKTIESCPSLILIHVIIVVDAHMLYDEK